MLSLDGRKGKDGRWGGGGQNECWWEESVMKPEKLLDSIRSKNESQANVNLLQTPKAFVAVNTK